MKKLVAKMAFTKALIMVSVFSLLSVAVQAEPGWWYKQRTGRHHDSHNSHNSHNRHSNHYNDHYNPIGHRSRVLPAVSFSLAATGLNFYYDSGGYYRKRGHDHALVRTPIGTFVQSLPAGYRTIYSTGRPYYYANHVYYDWDHRHRSYVIVNKPEYSHEVTPVATRGAQEIFVYPRKGQSTEQTSLDRYECYLWAVGQTGFEPSAGEPGNSVGYQRALGACLAGRGYTVK